MKRLFNANATYASLGLLIIRIGIGFSFIYNYGYGKITDPERWGRLGEKMSLIHIEFAPVFWGFMAAFAESFCAAFLLIGIFSRLSAFFLAFTMMIAFLSGFSKNEFNAHAFELMIVFIALLFTGPGKYSIDAKIAGFKK